MAEGPPGPQAGVLCGAAHFVLCRAWVACGAGEAVRASRLGSQAVQRPGALDAVIHRLIRVANDGQINAESVCTLLLSVSAAGWDCRSHEYWTTRVLVQRKWVKLGCSFTSLLMQAGYGVNPARRAGFIR